MHKRLIYFAVCILMVTENCQVSTTTNADCSRRKREAQVCLGLSILGNTDKAEGLVKGYFLCDQNGSEFCD